MKYKPLKEGDIIQIGDQFFNPYWEVGGPWYSIGEQHEVAGSIYNPDDYKPMRRKHENDHSR